MDAYFGLYFFLLNSKNPGYGHADESADLHHEARQERGEILEETCN
jgi:hypothetical protein